jgi:hypothetical protein
MVVQGRARSLWRRQLRQPRFRRAITAGPLTKRSWTRPVVPLFVANVRPAHRQGCEPSLILLALNPAQDLAKTLVLCDRRVDDMLILVETRGQGAISR